MLLIFMTTIPSKNDLTNANRSIFRTVDSETNFDIDLRQIKKCLGQECV